MADACTRIADMTLGELLEAIDEHLSNNRRGGRTISGIDGLAEYLGCSVKTAQRLKNSGRIDGAYVQVGRTITFDENKLKYRLQLK